MEITRQIVDNLQDTLDSKPQFIQIVYGPRQVGKTTAVRQLERNCKIPCVYSAADTLGVPDLGWIQTKWMEARALLGEAALLILDEVQLVDDWQRVVKGLWDYDRQHNLNVHVIITGSSALLLKKGSESLAGRFEKHELLQWSFLEMQKGFGFSFDEYILFGGYPGAASLIKDEQRWKDYIRGSIIETVLTKDVIALSNIEKPSLMQQLFKIVCSHPAEIVAYNKFLGQLADVGNVTTLSDYRLILEYAYILKTLDKWSGSIVSSRASKPKWILRDNAFITALSTQSVEQLKSSAFFGRMIENSVISHLMKIIQNGYYWRERDFEVDFVFEHCGQLFALEIKSGAKMRSNKGIERLLRGYPKAVPLIIGGNGIPVEEILLADKWRWS